MRIGEKKNRTSTIVKWRRAKMNLPRGFAVILAILCISLFRGADAIHKRCVKCRSRGELGSCKDPFTMNSTQIDMEKGVDAVPCASGWCGKIVESPNLNNDYGTATERMCFQAGPDDRGERCAFTTWNHKKVFLCICYGDLCNGATRTSIPGAFIVVIFVATVRWFV